MLFFNLTGSFHHFFLCFYLSFILLARFFGSLCCKSISKSIHDGHEVSCHEKDVGFEYIEKEDWESADDGSQSNLYEENLGFITFECSKNGNLVSNTISDEASPTQRLQDDQFCEEPPGDLDEEQISDCSIPRRDSITEKTPNEETDSVTSLVDQGNIRDTTLLGVYGDEAEDTSVHNIDTCGDEKGDKLNVVKNFLEDDGNFFTFSTKLRTKNAKPLGDHAEEALEESFTVGSTSKSSSEWRTSINYRDSVSEDRFSSSSRRSCPTWETCTAFQKYDEEMIFYDQISAQKLNETKLLKGVEVFRRSMSQKIVQKLTRRNKKPSEFQRSPYHELETAYVSQICLAWEALSFNYRNFLRFRNLHSEEDPGCPAYIAQQFQQFQVLLQRFIENEPYEHGRRPEIYARVRTSLPKLLQVPEFRDIDKTEKDQEEGRNTNISSVKFITIMQDGIRTFMNFLKADKKKHYQFFKAFIRRSNRIFSVDPTLLHMLKKANKKKKKKIKDICRVRKCLRKTMPRDEEMEILMGLIDLKVVSRVLKMSEISEEQVHWCEAKMSKLRFWEGKLQRDSSPLFFPAHPLL